MRRLALTVALLLAASSSYAKPDSRANEAKARYEAGRKEYAAGQYADAARDFARAYELVGDAGILYNAAQSFRLAGQWAMAGEAYRTLLDKIAVDASNRPEIQGRVVEMDERVADEKRRAERAQQDAARHDASKQDQPATGVPPEPTSAPHESARSHPGRTLEIVGYTLCGVTGAFLATGIAMSVLSKQANDDVQNAASKREVFTQSLLNDQSHGNTYDKVQIAAYVVAGAAAIGAGVTLALGMREDRRARDRQARVTITPSIGPGSFALMGQF